MSGPPLKPDVRMDVDDDVVGTVLPQPADEGSAAWGS